MIDPLAVVHGIILSLCIIGALATSILAMYRLRTVMTIISSTLVLLALIVAALPGPSLGIGFMLALGVLCAATGVIGGNPFAGTILALASKGSVPQGIHGGILLLGEDRREVLRGGLTIGLLERTAIMGTLLAGFPAGLAVIIAVKGVGRFTELGAAEAQERFIIGTFASAIWACAVAGVALLSGS